MRALTIVIALLLAAGELHAQCSGEWRGAGLVDSAARWIPSGGNFRPVVTTQRAPLPAPAGMALVWLDSSGRVGPGQTIVVAPAPVADSIRAEVAGWRFHPAMFRGCPVGTSLRAAIVRTGDTPAPRRPHPGVDGPLRDSAEAFVRELLVRLATGQSRLATAMIDSASLEDLHLRTTVSLAQILWDDSLPEVPVRPIPAKVRRRLADHPAMDSARFARRLGVDLPGLGEGVTLGSFMRMNPRAAMEMALRPHWGMMGSQGPFEIVGSFIERDTIAHVLVGRLGEELKADVELRRRREGWVAIPGPVIFTESAALWLRDGPRGPFGRPSPVRARPASPRATPDAPCDTGVVMAENTDTTARWIPAPSAFRPSTDRSRPRGVDLGLVQLTVDSLGIVRPGWVSIADLAPGIPADSVLAAAKAWRFHPASLAGCRVAVLMRVAVARGDAAARPAPQPGPAPDAEPPRDPAATVLAFHAALARGEHAAAAALLDPVSLRELRDAGVRFLVNWFSRDSVAVRSGAPLRMPGSWRTDGSLDRAAFERFREVALPNLATGATLGSLAAMPPTRMAELLLAKDIRRGSEMIPVIRGVAIDGDSVAHVLGWLTAHRPSSDDPWPTQVYHVVRRDGRWYLHGGNPVLSSTSFVLNGPNVELPVQRR